MSEISSINWGVQYAFERREQIYQRGELIQQRSQSRGSDQAVQSSRTVVAENPAVVAPAPVSAPVIDKPDSAGEAGVYEVGVLDMDVLILESLFKRRMRSAEPLSSSHFEPKPTEAPRAHAVQVSAVQFQSQPQSLSERSDTSAYMAVFEREQLSVDLQVRWSDSRGNLRAGSLAFTQYRELSVEVELNQQQLATMLDPLVLNFDDSVELSAKRVNFDLTDDGQDESIATLASNSFYLALDKNDNGRIDSGAELFGAITNDGFAELAEYDADGNNFIDSDDAIFSRLQLFRPGSGELIDLAQMGVEGIYLGSQYSPFQLQSASGDTLGQTLGQARQTGFFYTDTGLNSIQQIDLAV